MPIPSGGLHLGVFEELSNHRKALAECHRARSKTVSAVVMAQINNPHLVWQLAPGAAGGLRKRSHGGNPEVAVGVSG